jgi:DNA polymerase I-like protein with 3'-5' exonuclease and polymerase domains
MASVPRDSVVIGNVCNCRPPNNAEPKPNQIAACSHWLDLYLSLANPQIIVAMGAFAIRRILGPNAGTVEHLHGRTIVLPTGQIVLPCYHPAAALYDTSTLRQVNEDFQVLRGLVTDHPVSDYIVTDDYPNPIYTVADTPALVSQMRDEVRDVGEFAIDTETVNRNTELWSAQVSCVPGTAWFVPMAPKYTGKLDLKSWSSTAIVHYYLSDIKWLDILDGKFIDTMVMAYLLGLPQGLKELAHRLCGVEMTTYQEMVRPYQLELTMEYLSKVMSQQWPKPEPVEETNWDNDAGKIITSLRKPQPMNQKVKRILTDYAKDSSKVDPYERWKSISQPERNIVEEVLGLMPESDLSRIPFDDAVAYSSRDAQVTLRVKHKMAKLITECGLDFILNNVDLAILPMINEMMQNGMPLDLPHLKSLSADYAIRMATVAERAAGKVGHPFNPNSAKQVETLVYDELGFEYNGHLTQTKKRSTDDRELKKIQHPVITDILEYRRLLKNKTSFADSMVENAKPHQMSVFVDGIEKQTEIWCIHTTLKTTRVDTGRISSSDPINLQAIPVRNKEAKKIRNGVSCRLGWKMAAADFSGQEMRLMTHASQCKFFLELFHRGGDAHTEMAARIFGLSLDEAGKERYRYPTKRLNFGVIYGISAKGLADDIAEHVAEVRQDAIAEGEAIPDIPVWSEQDCDKLIVDWYKLCPEVKDYRLEKIAEARRFGYVTDIFGRRRYTPEVSCPIQDIREAGERYAGNFPIQGGSATITKLAMAALWKDRDVRGWRELVRFLIQIHDDITVEFRDTPGFESQVVNWMETTMGSVVKFSIPMPADVKTGFRWGSLEKMKHEAI